MLAWLEVCTMMPAIAPVLLLSLCFTLAACIGPRGLVSPQATSAQALARMGTPTDIRFDASGEELWEYATGPSGLETYLVRIGADGRVREVTQLLTQERLMTIEPGKSTKRDVRHRLGRPKEISFLRSGEVWSWRFRLGGVQTGHLAVAFNPDGTVRDRMVLLDSDGERSRDK
jgi:hypothetical protein